MLEKLMTNPYAWLFLSAITVVSFVFAVWSWYATKPRKEISIHCKTDEIIKAGQQKIKKLEVMFDGNAIEDLSSTKFYIWNSGNQVLSNSDIVPSKPLKIYTDSSKILDVQILRVTDETNLFEIASASGNQVTLAFDYVEQGGGVLVQVLHTGNSSELVFDCKIKGGREIRDCTATNKNRYVSRRDKILETIADMVLGLGGLFIFFGPPLILSAITPYLPDTPIGSVEKIVGIIALVIAYIVFVVAGVKLSVFLWTALRRTFNLSIPSTLLATSPKKE